MKQKEEDIMLVRDISSYVRVKEQIKPTILNNKQETKTIFQVG